MSTQTFRYALRSVRVIMQSGAYAELGAELAVAGWRRALIVTTPTRARGLSTVEWAAGTFDGSRQHVPADLVDHAMKSVDEARPDVLVAVGGGSPIGLAKALALRTSLPIAAVPTTYSGSEMTRIWGITEDGHKRTGRDERVAPALVVYDPELTLTLDPLTSAASGMNAIAHAVEALYAPDANPVASLFAERSIELLATALRTIAVAPADRTARTDAMLGAHLAARSLDMTQMGLHHRLCHLIGGAFDVPHALTHAVLLPHVARFNLTAAPAAAETIAKALQAVDAAQGLEALNADLGIHGCLRDFGITTEDLRRTVIDWSFSSTSPRPASADDAIRILEAAF